VNTRGGGVPGVPENALAAFREALLRTLLAGSSGKRGTLPP
jgi:hypothetical protein